jgi:carbon monoxide dehydrogenase subunit G
VVKADRDRIWAVLTDPDAVARLTPFVRSIRADGADHWIWSMSGLSVLGVGFSATFTERMTLKPQERIDFEHEPPAGQSERAGVRGFYCLADAPDGGTALETSLEVTVDLPLPKVSGGAVRSTMKGVMGTMGARFSQRLLAEVHAS